MENKPQSVQFGKQPPAEVDSVTVQFGKVAGSAETETHTPGDDAPTHADAEPETTESGGIVPEYAGGDPVPADDDSGAADDGSDDDDDDEAPYTPENPPADAVSRGE